MFLDSLRDGPLGGRRAVPGAGAVRPQPQCPRHGRRAAVRAARLRARRADGGSGPRTCVGPGPYVRTRRRSPSRRRTSAMRACSATAWHPSRPSGRGERSWWLGQLVEAAPLDGWRAAASGAVTRRRSWRCRWRTTGRTSCTPPGAGRPCGSGTPTGRGRCWVRRARRPGGRRPAGGSSRRAGEAADRTCPPTERAGGWPSSSRRTACPRRSSCSACARCRGPSRSGGRWSTRWTSRGTRAVIPWSFSGVMGLAERCLDPAEADRLDVLTAVTGRAGGRVTGRRRLLVGGVPAPGRHPAPARDDARGTHPATHATTCERRRPGGRCRPDDRQADGHGTARRTAHGHGPACQDPAATPGRRPTRRARPGHAPRT